MVISKLRNFIGLGRPQEASQRGSGEAQPSPAEVLESIRKKKSFCPRCGQPGEKKLLWRGRRLYVYMYHGRINGKIKTCYLGPLGGYIYGKFKCFPLTIS